MISKQYKAFNFDRAQIGIGTIMTANDINDGDLMNDQRAKIGIKDSLKS